MPRAFISYARKNKSDIDQLDRHLHEMGWQPWADTSLHGGQEWWDEILRQIEGCDVFIATISPAALASEACERELDWAEALGKRVLPVAVGSVAALPGRFARLQFVDYSEPGNRDRAAITLSRALWSLQSTPPAPPPRFRPRPPPAPQSYLTEIVDLASSRHPLDQRQQRDVLFRLEAALTSDDPRERQGGAEVLDRLSRRTDLYADVRDRIAELKRRLVKPPSPPKAPQRPPKPSNYRASTIRLSATLLAVAAITGAIPPIYLLATDYPPGTGRIWYWQVLARVLIGISFCILGSIARSLGGRFATWSAVCVVGAALLHAATETLVLATDNLGPEVYDFLKIVAYPIVIALASLAGIMFGLAVIARSRVAWASVLIAWGVCGLWEAYLSHEAKVAPWNPWEPPAAAWKTADSVLIIQNLILLAVAVFMLVESRQSKTSRGT